MKVKKHIWKGSFMSKFKDVVKSFQTSATTTTNEQQHQYIIITRTINISYENVMMLKYHAVGLY